MNHCGYGNLDAEVLKIVNRREGLLKGAFAPEGIVTLLHSIKADLDLVNAKFSNDVSCNQVAIGEKDGSELKFSQDSVDFPEVRMEQRLAAGKKETKSLNFFELVAYLLDCSERKVLVVTLSKVTVAAL